MEGDGFHEGYIPPHFAPLEPNLSPDAILNETPNRPESNKRNRSNLGRLNVLQLQDWDKESSYDEDPPICLHYSIEWKVTVNGKVVSKDTEQDLVLAPASHWQHFLQPRLEKLLRKKMAHSRFVRCDDTNVVVSVTDRTERDLTKRFDELEIDWSVVEKQLATWADLFQAGKKLRVDLTFNYVEGDHHSAVVSLEKG